MVNLNDVKVVGVVVKDGVVSTLPNGTDVLNFRAAINRPYQRDGEWQQATTYVDVALFGKAAKPRSEVAKKGATLLIEGDLKNGKYKINDEKSINTVYIQAQKIQAMRVAQGAAQEPEIGGESVPEEIVLPEV